MCAPFWFASKGVGGEGVQFGGMGEGVAKRMGGWLSKEVRCGLDVCTCVCRGKRSER